MVPRSRVAWRQCANHPRVAAASVCSQCQKGWCPECAQKQGTAIICPSCDALCRSVAEQAESEELVRRRARPLRSELGEVFAYPFSDPLSYVILSIFVGVFSLLSAMALAGGGLGRLISQGLVFAYAFSAINRVSTGKKQSFMPEISDLTDLFGPVRHGFAAMLVSSGPLLLLLFLFPAAAAWSSRSAERPHAAATELASVPTGAVSPEPAALGGEHAFAPRSEADTSGGDGESAPSLAPTLGILAVLGLALLWKIAYSPVALIAAAISHSFLSTLNPVVGVAAIRRMGSVYWEAMIAYTILSVAETVLSLAFGMIPIAGHILRAFVQCYAYLAIGCLLGLAVFKKAPELGLD
jgi:hypothetical protein